jgi:autotransporter-associated beta strand protein
MTSRTKTCRSRLETLEDRLAPAVVVWDGGSLDSDRWSEDFNWVGDVAPSPGDHLVFAAAADQFTAVNDFAPGTSFRSITLEASYELSGNAITLASTGGGVDAPPPAFLEAGSGSSSISFGIFVPPNPILPIDPCRLIVHGNLKLAGVVSGAPDLEKTGDGTLILTAANTFTGRMLVQDGVLSIADNQALGASAAGTELFGDALLALDGRRGADDPPLDLTIAGEALTIGEDAALPTPPPIRLASLGGANTWAGTIHTDVFTPLPPPIRILTESSLELAGPIGGDGGFEKAGLAPLILSAANTFDGKVTVAEGTLSVRHSQALGSTTAGVELAVDATVELFAAGLIITGESLGFIPPIGTSPPAIPIPKFRIRSRGGDNVWAGPIHTNVFTGTVPIFEITTESSLELAGVIDGGTELEKLGFHQPGDHRRGSGQRPQ